MIKGFIFDLDGVIVDTAKYHYIAWKSIAEELGIHFTEEENEKLKGVGRMQSLDIILQWGNKNLSESEKIAWADKKNERFVQYIDKMKADEIFPGVKELLITLRQNDKRISLGSASKNADSVLAKLGITHLFDAMVNGTMITKSKPDPEIFLLAAKKLNLPPSDCIVFEDAEAGVQAAKAAGMKCVGIGSKDILHQADIVLKNTGDFTLQMIA